MSETTPGGISLRDFVEAALATASEVGEGPQRYETGKIEDKLSPTARRNVALTKVGDVPGVFVSEMETYKTSSGHFRNEVPEFRTGSLPVEAAALCEKLGITFDEAADAVRQARKEEPPEGTPLPEDVVYGPRLVELLSNHSCGAGPKAGLLGELFTPSEAALEEMDGGRPTARPPLKSGYENSSARASEADNGHTAGWEITTLGRADPVEEGALPSREGSPSLSSTGIEGATPFGQTPKTHAQRLQASKIVEVRRPPEKRKLVTSASNDVDTGIKAPLKARRSLARTTCEEETREAIFEYVPQAREDEIVFRWCVYALWSQWDDEETGRLVLHHEIVQWIGHYRFDAAKEVLNYIKGHLPIEYTDTWAKNRFTRQVRDDGLPGELWKTVKADLRTPPSDYENRVYILTGRRVSPGEASDMRAQIEEELSESQGPSPTAHRIRRAMNNLPSNTFSRFNDRLEDAFEYVRRMEVNVTIPARKKAALRGMSGCEKDDDTGELTGNVSRYKARLRYEKRKKAEEQRDEYFQVLQDIAKQHKPYYNFSSKGRTDRIFSYNNSVLLLPSEVREILCEGLHDVDLKSAHLSIAAWLWNAEKALGKLTQDNYSVWVDLMEHLRPLFEKQGVGVPKEGGPLYDRVKDGLKIMVYSVVYGMPASALQAEVTKTLKPILGSNVGERLRAHPLIQELLEKRDEKLNEMEPGDVLEGPTGIRIEVEKEIGEEDEDGLDRIGPKTAMACIAQSFEQELMSVLLDVAEYRDRFQPLLWLHDGAACNARYLNALKTSLEEALLEKRKELTEFAGRETLIPAEFEVDKIQAPELPPENVHDRIAAAGGGVLRLKDGETAIKVDAKDGRELEPAETNVLVKHEHELYRVADTHVRVTKDGYSVESDPYLEDKLWQPANSPLTRIPKDGINRRTPAKTNTPSIVFMPGTRRLESPPAEAAERRTTKLSTSPDSEPATESCQQRSDRQQRTPHYRRRRQGEEDREKSKAERAWKKAKRSMQQRRRRPSNALPTAD
jgi:hypothetical protein